jgi:uncharacterized protein YegP (UPF0339 family)
MPNIPISPFEGRSPLLAVLCPGDPLVDAAFQQLKLDYAAAGTPVLSAKAFERPEFAPAESHSPEIAEQAAVSESALAYFEMYFADRVRLTSTRCAGGEWSWQLCSAEGGAVAHGGGYRTEAECLSAIDLVRRAAGSAPIRRR